MSFAQHQTRAWPGVGEQASRRSARGNASSHSRVQKTAGALRHGLDSPAHSLDASTRRIFNARFGHDFSRVRIHTGQDAAASARAVSAQAYTVGNDVVFGHDRYNPATPSGQRLLAHELTHVAQQSGPSPQSLSSLGPSNSAQEHEAESLSAGVMAGHSVPGVAHRSGPVLARFSDTNHHIIEEAALEGSGLTPEQIKGLEMGNVKRDYSQLPSAANAILLGHAQQFGGYGPDEHIDNFIFDVENDRWRSRGVGPQKYRYLDPKHEDFGPIEHIAAQLRDLAYGGMGKESMEHLGNAFHTVEDFFAHSNFIELTHKDDRFGKDLLTASVSTEPGNETASTSQVLGSIAPQTMAPYYAAQGAAAKAKTETTSHANMNKDTSQSAGFAEARRIAALVIQELAADVVSVMKNEPDPSKRAQLMESIVMKKVRHYLRPPDPKDPWWEGLASNGGGLRMDAKIAAAEKRTPVTVNQMPFSPLRNLEASKDSPMAMPVGVAFNLGRAGMIQAGGGLMRPNNALDSRFTPPSPPSDQRSSFVAGAQWTGHF